MDPTVAGLIEAVLAAFAVIGGGIAVASGFFGAVTAMIYRDQAEERDARVAAAVNDGIAVGFALGAFPGLGAFAYYLTEVPT